MNRMSQPGANAGPAGPAARFWFPVCLVLAVFASLGIGSACRLTTTHDEYWHLPVGLLNLRAGRFHFDNLNPPLCRMAAALPLLATAAKTGPASAAHDAMGWGDEFIERNGGQYRTLFALGRTVIVLLAVAAALVSAIWARELFGNRAGCLAAVLWAFEPNLIAHGSLVTTDMGAAAFFVFTLFAAWKFARRVAWKTAVVFGLLLGLAQLVKFTSLLLYPAGLAVFVLGLLAARRERADAKSTNAPPQARKIVALWLAAVVLSVAVLNAGYLFRGSFSALRTYDFQSGALRELSSRLPAAAWVPLPLPRDYVEGIDRQRRVMEQKHPVFLDGQWSEDGFRRYYLWALFYKLPHALQLLIFATALWIVMPGGKPRRLLIQAMLVLPAVAIVAVAESSGMQLGIRYVLPAVPFLILFASQSAQWFEFKTYPLRTVAVAALAAGMIASVRYHPHHLAYFNELAGGPLGGREHLLDSNLDWGQDLDGLRRLLDEKGVETIGLAYFGTVPPASRGIRYFLPPSRAPRPGLYAVSVNFEQGRPHWVRTPEGTIRQVDIGEFAYFGYFQPVARAGYSIDVFKLTEQDVNAWQSAARQAIGR